MASVTPQGRLQAFLLRFYSAQELRIAFTCIRDGLKDRLPEPPATTPVVCLAASDILAGDTTLHQPFVEQFQKDRPGLTLEAEELKEILKELALRPMPSPQPQQWTVIVLVLVSLSVLVITTLAIGRKGDTIVNISKGLGDSAATSDPGFSTEYQLYLLPDPARCGTKDQGIPAGCTGLVEVYRKGTSEGTPKLCRYHSDTTTTLALEAADVCSTGAARCWQGEVHLEAGDLLWAHRPDGDCSKGRPPESTCDTRVGISKTCLRVP